VATLPAVAASSWGSAAGPQWKLTDPVRLARQHYRAYMEIRLIGPGHGRQAGGKMTDLGTLGGRDMSLSAVNERGEVIGESSGQAFISGTAG